MSTPDGFARSMFRALQKAPRGHELLPEELAASLPALYKTEDVPEGEKLARVKFFTPMSGWTWYGIEYDPADKLFFGYVVSGLGADCDEYGYFDLVELDGLGGAIERDLHFTPTPMSEIIQNRGDV